MDDDESLTQIWKFPSISVSEWIRFDARDNHPIHVIEFSHESRGIILHANYPEWNILNRIYDTRAKLCSAISSLARFGSWFTRSPLTPPSIRG